MNARIAGKARRTGGFSLIELLVTIMVIGVITGIAITVINKVQDKSEKASARRHAQIVASMAENAIHAGDTSISSAPDKESALKRLAAGVVGAGAFAGVHIRLDLTDKEQLETLPYLEFVDGRLTAVVHDE